jgi:hypothetical protein
MADAVTDAPATPTPPRWWSDVDHLKRFVDFDLDDLEWTKVTAPKEGRPGMPESIYGQLDFEAFYGHGMWTAFIDAGAFNILGIKLAPDFTIPRHHHNSHQLVLVHQGELWQGANRFVPGDGYFTRAEHPYSVTAGPEGSVAFEIRADPIQHLTTAWDEGDPSRWVHGRRPGGPAESAAADS